MTDETQFDAIVIGSGISGGWAAKELTEKGLKTLLVERGPMIEHQTDYKTETIAPWDLPLRGYGDQKMFAEQYPVQRQVIYFNEWTQKHFVNDREHPYQTSEKEPFQWRRGYQLGGKSLLWGRQCYRWSDLDFGANAADGHGIDWPIRYRDIAPWYDHVESFIGVSGSREQLPQLPDGIFQKPMAMNAVEQVFKERVERRYAGRKVIIGRSANMTESKPGRSPCQYRNICARGCSYGAYFSTQSSTLPAARATGNLTLVTDTMVESIEHDPRTGRATGVRVIDTNSRTRKTFTARVIFVCAGSVNSISTLLRSTSERFPNGLANDSGVLGRYFMDHALAMSVTARIPGFDEHGYFGNRPNSIIVPRYMNIDGQHGDLLRGYSFQGSAYRAGWPRGAQGPGIGAEFQKALRGPGDWHFFLGAFAEMLPNADNRVTLDPKHLDQYGLPQTRITFSYGPNERKLLEVAAADAKEMLGLLDAEILSYTTEPGLGGSAVHEMGGARMGADPAQSILNRHNQTHNVPNVFVTDGAAMASTAVQNPSLTYMALTARAAGTAASMLKEGKL